MLLSNAPISFENSIAHDSVRSARISYFGTKVTYAMCSFLQFSQPARCCFIFIFMNEASFYRHKLRKSVRKRFRYVHPPLLLTVGIAHISAYLAECIFGAVLLGASFRMISKPGRQIEFNLSINTIQPDRRFVITSKHVTVECVEARESILGEKLTSRKSMLHVVKYLP